ncbi:MAG: hypothetical protein K2X39_09470, partial [Silvanigrellaceae bacterium]|nr:hypothetical protein [Silvanigrellaceae bacterium]
MQDILYMMHQNGYLSATELVAIRKTCRELGENPIRIMRSLNILPQDEIQSYLQKYYQVNAFKNEGIDELNSAYQIFLPKDLAINYSCFAMGEIEGKIFIALEDPCDKGVIRQLEFFLNKKIVAVAATAFQIAHGIHKIYGIPISELKLTTLIDKSRGVIAGIDDDEYITKQKEISAKKDFETQMQRAEAQKDYHQYAKNLRKNVQKEENKEVFDEESETIDPGVSVVEESSLSGNDFFEMDDHVESVEPAVEESAVEESVVEESVVEESVVEGPVVEGPVDEEYIKVNQINDDEQAQLEL